MNSRTAAGPGASSSRRRRCSCVTNSRDRRRRRRFLPEGRRDRSVLLGPRCQEPTRRPVSTAASIRHDLLSSVPMASCLRSHRGIEDSQLVTVKLLGSQADACLCSMASAISTANPRAVAIALAADTVLDVPIIGATATRAPCTSSRVKPASAAAARFNRYDGGRSVARCQCSKAHHPKVAVIEAGAAHRCRGHLHDGVEEWSVFTHSPVPFSCIWESHIGPACALARSSATQSPLATSTALQPPRRAQADQLTCLAVS